MKYIFLAFLFVILSFTSRRVCEYVDRGLGEQVGPIKMGYTTIEEAKDTLQIINQINNLRHFGIHDSRKKIWTKGIYYEYALNDTLKGIRMRAWCRKLHVINEIELRTPCKWKVGKGITIGMTFDEIKNKLGKPDDETDTTIVPNSNRGYSQYHSMRYGNIYIHSLHKMNTQGGCYVDLIEIHCSTVYRPNAGKYYIPLFPARRLMPVY